MNRRIVTIDIETLPAPETVDQRAGTRLAGQPCGDQLLRRETLLPQVFGEQVPAVRREPTAVPLGGGLVEAALGEELAGRTRPGRTAS